MVQKNQATRFEELLEKLSAIEQAAALEPAPDLPTRLGPADRIALATEMQRLQTQLELLYAECDRNCTADHWRGSGEMSPGADDPGASFAQSQVELSYIQLREQKVTAEIWIAQSRGINACWQIADRLNRTYRGHGYVTMQPDLTERDLRANREVAAAVSEDADRAMIETAFAVATVLNRMGGSQRTWDNEWMTTEQRVQIITESYRLLRQIVDYTLLGAAQTGPIGVPRSEVEVYLM